MLQRWRNLLTVLAACVITIGFTAGPVHASSQSKPEHQKTDIQIRKSSTLHLRMATPEGPIQQADAEGCSWEITASAVGHYDSQTGTLQLIEGFYQAITSCDFNVSSIDATAKLWKNDLPVDVAQPWICEDCNGSISGASILCAGITCAGSYVVSHTFTIWLYDPNFWPPPAGDGCQILGPDQQLLSCTHDTSDDPMVFPPVL
ncbi:hypothetical protein [Flindersiella endophytica]